MIMSCKIIGQYHSWDVAKDTVKMQSLSITTRIPYVLCKWSHKRYNLLKFLPLSFFLIQPNSPENHSGFCVYQQLVSIYC